MRKYVAFIATALLGCGLLGLSVTAADFEGGELFGTIISDKTGYIDLARDKTVGTYTSAEISATPFRYMVLSWNSDTPKGTMLRIEAKVRVNGRWSDWLFLGSWSTDGDKSSAGPLDMSGDDIAYADVDTLTVRGDDGETADAYAYRLSLFSVEPGVTPSVRMIKTAFRNDLPGQEIQRQGDIPKEELDAFTGTLDVKPLAQTTRDPQFANVICSPVSAAMVLDYHGVHILPEMAAMGVFDRAYDGYGNWAFNAAFIGSCGLESYVIYCADFDDVKLELMAGNPVICSVKYKQSNKVTRNLPVIDAAPIEFTNGHLLVVVGYERRDGKTYVVVNDPAAATDGEVRRLYEESQFIEAWEATGRVAYITHNTGIDLSEPLITDALLAPTSRTTEQDGVLLYEYMLTDTDKDVISAAKAVSPDGERIQTGVTIVAWDEALGAVHSYAIPAEGPGLWLNADQAGQTVYVFLGTGNYYRVSRGRE
ncbi:MAG: C39 family peptidase [Clostridiales bacterium]|jgi:uncharacterized protein YvpB|nr:C39 family peptidase [Clostridiales bacterium]